MVAFFTGVRGGEKGCYLQGPYCSVTIGDFESGNLHACGIEFITALGFSPREYPRDRKINGYSSCNFEENSYNKVPPFVCLPKVLQEAIEFYADLTEGLAALANKLAPCVQYREPDPQEKRRIKHNIEKIQTNRATEHLSCMKRSRDMLKKNCLYISFFHKYEYSLKSHVILSPPTPPRPVFMLCVHGCQRRKIR